MDNELNVAGLVGMILGIISMLVFPLWVGLVAMVVSFGGIEHENKKMAIAGLCLGIAGIVFGLIKGIGFGVWL